eukprot:753251-Hanusia_phi.AAC.1
MDLQGMRWVGIGCECDRWGGIKYRGSRMGRGWGTDEMVAGRSLKDGWSKRNEILIRVGLGCGWWVGKCCNGGEHGKRNIEHNGGTNEMNSRERRKGGKETANRETENTEKVKAEQNN